MKANFALLVSKEICNAVQSLAWEIHSKYRTGMGASHLPPHISLRQPFDVADLAALETYMRELAAGLKPIDVHLTDLRLMPARVDGIDSGMLFMEVEETEALLSAHRRLNDDLAARFGGIRRDYGGGSYRFHLTLMFGGQPFSVYSRIHDEYAARISDLRCVVGEIALLVYDEHGTPNADHMTYATLPLGSSVPPANSDTPQNLTML